MGMILDEFVQAASCADCPFNETGPGRHLRNTLRPGRFDSILADLREGKVFLCHKTTPETGDGSEKVCAGALAYQRRNGCVPDGVQVAERLAAIQEGRRARW